MHFRLPRIIGYTQIKSSLVRSLMLVVCALNFDFTLQRTRITAIERIITSKFHFGTIIAETKLSRVNLKANVDKFITQLNKFLNCILVNFIIAVTHLHVAECFKLIYLYYKYRSDVSLYLVSIIVLVVQII